MTIPHAPGPTSDVPATALETALRLLGMGLWPVLITPHDPGDPQAGKRPIGEKWGLERPTEQSLRAAFARHPRAGLGIRLGPEGGVIDLDCDGPGSRETLQRMFGGEIVESLGWTSERGLHLVLAWDDRLLDYGITVAEAHPHYPGVGLRFGAAPGKQFQSVCPPSLTSRALPDGRVVPGPPRQWNDCWAIAPIPESLFADLDRHAARPVGGRPIVIPAAGPIRQPDSSLRRYARSALGREIERLRSSAVGDRNNLLNVAAFNLGQLIGAGVLDSHEVSQALETTAREIGLGDRETRATIRSGIEDGRAQPRDLSGLSSIPFCATSRSILNGHSNSRRAPDGGDFVNKNKTINGSQQELGEEWSPPRLKESIEPTPFPLAVYPSTLADLCRSGAASMQCPVDYFAASALALAGGAIGLSVALTVKPGYHEAANLYLGIVGPPGSRKTPALKRMAAPLFGIDRGLREVFQADQLRYEEDLRIYQAMRKGGNPGPPPVAPIPAQLTIDDSTVEAFALVHSENPRGLTMILDEMTAWVAGLNAYRQGLGADKEFWLRCNSGSLVKVNRKSSRVPVLIPQPCATIVGCLTPSSLPSMRGSKRNDGWMDRILFCYPESMILGNWDESTVPQDLFDDWVGAVGRLWARSMVIDERGRPRPFFVDMTREAKLLWSEWINAHRAEARALDFPHRSLDGPWSKMEGFAARMALILSQLHQAFDPTNEGPPASVQALDVWGARQLIEYFKVHFRRARQDLVHRVEDIPDEPQAILDWIARHERTEFSEHDIRRQLPRFSLQVRDDALNWLLARGFIRPKPRPDRLPSKPGRSPSRSFDVNPYLRPHDFFDFVDEIPTEPYDETTYGNSSSLTDF